MQVSIADELYQVHKLTSPSMRVRVSFATAREILIRNKNVLTREAGGGRFRFYQIKELGLGVYEIRLRPAGANETIMVKEWEEIPSTGWGDLSD